MQAVRMCSYGQEEVLLTSRTIWVCAACETCTTRCPNGIDIARMMDLLRSRAMAAKKGSQEPHVLAFHKAFLNSVRAHGRVFEVGMIANYKMRSFDLFSDMGLGVKMIMRNKLKFFPTRIQGTGEVRAMFKKKK
jgi:heterodisulfide reductase subunit C